MNILLIEDKLVQIQGCLQTFKKNKYTYQVVDTYKKGEILAMSRQYDIVLFNEKLCDIKRIQEMRQTGFLDPIVIMSKTIIDHEVAILLDHGVDDVWSYKTDENLLSSKLNALLRRVDMSYEEVYLLGDIKFSPQNAKLSYKNEEVSLTKKESDLLMYFYINKNIALSKERLRKAVWYNQTCEGNTIEVYISYLRKKLKTLHSNFQIKTKRNVGYMLTKTPCK